MPETVVSAVYKCRNCGLFFARSIRTVEGEIKGSPVLHLARNVNTGESSEYMKLNIGGEWCYFSLSTPDTLHACHEGDKQEGAIIMGAAGFVRYSVFTKEEGKV